MDVARWPSFPLDVCRLDLRRFRVFDLIGLVRISGLFSGINIKEFPGCFGAGKLFD